MILNSYFEKQPPEVGSIKEAVLKDFAISTGKDLCWSFLIKSFIFIEKDSNKVCSSENYEIYKSTCFEGHSLHKDLGHGTRDLGPGT